MNLMIYDNFKITSDSMQYILQEKKVVEKVDSENFGNVYWNDIGYYGKLNYALKAYKEREIRLSDVVNVNQLLELIEKLDKKIENLLRGN